MACTLPISWPNQEEVPRQRESERGQRRYEQRVRADRSTREANRIARLKDDNRPSVEFGEVEHLLDTRTGVKAQVRHGDSSKFASLGEHAPGRKEPNLQALQVGWILTGAYYEKGKKKLIYTKKLKIKLSKLTTCPVKVTGRDDYTVIGTFGHLDRIVLLSVDAL